MFQRDSTIVHDQSEPGLEHVTKMDQSERCLSNGIGVLTHNKRLALIIACTQ